MTADNSRTQISEPSQSNVEKRNSSKYQTVLEKPLDVHSDGGRSQERTGDDNQLSDKLRGPVESHQASRATLQQNSTGINQLILFNGTIEA
jgi:hypothetical protein